MLIEGRISKYKVRTAQEFIRCTKDNDVNDYVVSLTSNDSYCYDDSTSTTATIDRANNSVVKYNAQINNNKNLITKTRGFISFIREKNKQQIVLTGLLGGLVQAILELVEGLL